MPMPSITKWIGRCKRLTLILMALLLLPVGALAIDPETSVTLGIISTATQYLNPLAPVEREFRSLTSLMYEGLVEIDDDLQPQPALCRSWDVSSGGGTWTFYLRDGIAFHDGTPLTAEDVVATARAIIDLPNTTVNGNKGAYSSLQYFVKDISAPDKSTVVVKTSRTNYAFLYAMVFPILPKDRVQVENPPGTGPYKMDQFVAGDFIALSANPHWWRGTPALKSIMAIFHTANRELISSFEYNRVDAVITRSLNAAQYRSGVSSLNLSYRTQQLETLMLNNRARELTDVRVRRAIRYAVNIEDLLSTIYMDMAQRADTPMMPGTWMYNEIDGFEFNPARANELLDESGWKDSDGDGIRDTVIDGNMAKMSLRFVLYEEQDNSVRMMAATKIAAMLEDVGIEARIDMLPFEECRARLKAGSYDIALAAFNMDSAPDPGFLLMTNNTGNYARYSSQPMDALFTTLRAAINKEDYKAALDGIQALFVEDCPFICLYYRKGALLTRKMFTNARDLREPEVLRGIAQGVAP